MPAAWQASAICRPRASCWGEHGDGLGQFLEPADEMRHLEVPVRGETARAGAWVDMAGETAFGQPREERLPSLNRPVGLLESRGVVPHLRRRGEDGADEGEPMEAAREKVVGGGAPDGGVVADHAHARRKRVGGMDERRLRIEDHLGRGMGG